MTLLSVTASLVLKKERALRHALLYFSIDYSSTADSSVISIISGVFFTTSILR